MFLHVRKIWDCLRSVWQIWGRFCTVFVRNISVNGKMGNNFWAPLHFVSEKLVTKIRLNSAFSLGGRGCDAGILTRNFHAPYRNIHQSFWKWQNSTFLRFFFKPRVVQTVMLSISEADTRNVLENAKLRRFLKEKCRQK